MTLYPIPITRVLWPQDLFKSGYLTEVDSFSKMLHGVAALLPDQTQVQQRPFAALIRLHLLPAGSQRAFQNMWA